MTACVIWRTQPLFGRLKDPTRSVAEMKTIEKLKRVKPRSFLAMCPTTSYYQITLRTIAGQLNRIVTETLIEEVCA
jgi:hypothetical protein